MRYLLAALAAAAAVAAALLFRPPHAAGGSTFTAEPAEHRRAAAPARRDPALVVYVAGEVRTPGVYRLAPQARAADALERAGGAKPSADLVAVNLAAPLHDGEEIAVPKIGAPAPHARRPPAPRTHARRAPHVRAARRPRPAELTPEIVDLNSADEAELQTLPGIGPALAARIVAYREINGAFAAVDELADVSGVTPHLLDAIVPYATVR